MKLGTVPLAEAARYVVAPAGIRSTSWPSVRDTCRKLGWDFDAWQADAGRLILSKRSDGQYAADTIVISIPRQVGKTYLVACIIFGLCLLEPGLTVIWTAHHKATAAETFGSFSGMAKRPKVKPQIRQVTVGKGDEKILFVNGSRILFGARESGFGRGFSDVDVIVWDEAQMLPESTLEDMAASQNVAENPLTFMMGTPPRLKDAGEMFSMLRQEALDGEVDDTLYIEMSADFGCDPMDRAQWRKANPSYPFRTSERALLRLRKKLVSEDSWNREALGIHDPISRHQPVLKPSEWRELLDVGPGGDVKPDAIGVDMSHGLAISVVGCWVEGESAHIEEVWAGTDVAAALDWVTMVAGRLIQVVIDDLSPAAQMIPELKARKVNIHRGTTRDMAKGCLAFETRGKAHNLTHAGQESVTDAMLGGRKRPLSPTVDAGAWGWDRSDSTIVIHPLVAATLALFGAVSQKNVRKTGDRTAIVM